MITVEEIKKAVKGFKGSHISIDTDVRVNIGNKQVQILLHLKKYEKYDIFLEVIIPTTLTFYGVMEFSRFRSKVDTIKYTHYTFDGRNFCRIRKFLSENDYRSNKEFNSIINNVVLSVKSID